MVLTLFCSAGVTAGQVATEDISNTQTGSRQIPPWQGEGKAHISLCYTLEKDSWLAFRLPPLTEQVKIVTNANVQGRNMVDARVELPYSLEYQLLDGDGEVVRASHYHHRSRISRYSDAESRQEVTAAYYFDGLLVPADERVATLDFTGLHSSRKIAGIRLRLEEAGQQVSDVVLRLYVPAKPSEMSLDHLWQRLAVDRKNDLARGNVFGADFLSEQEKENLLRQMRQPLAPIGTQGADYSLRKLYVRKEIELAPPEEPLFRKGISFGSGTDVTLPVPEEGGRLKFVISDDSGGDVPPETPVRLTWFGKNQEREVRQILIYGGVTEYEDEFRGGLVELHATHPLAVQMLRMQADGEVDITPEPLLLRTFSIDDSKNLVYQLSHVGQQPTPLRISCRSVLLEGHGGVGGSVHYRLMDSQGSVAGEGDIMLPFELSRYDRIHADPSAARLSEPVTKYLRVAPHISAIELSSSGLTLINAHTRPPNLDKVVRVPEDYYQASVHDEERQMSWFPIMPVGFQELLGQQRAVSVAAQVRPPEYSPDLAEGNFLWEALPPETGGGHHLLVPAEEKEYQRDSLPKVIFHRLRPNEPQTLHLLSDHLLSEITPRLFFHRSEDGRPFSVRMEVDGRAYLQGVYQGKSGLIDLPPIAEGPHHLTVTVPSSVSLYMSHIEGDGQGYQLIFANQLEKQGLSFEYPEKHRC